MFPCLKLDKKCLSFPRLPLPQIKMSVPSFLLCAPLTAPSAPTPMAAISAALRGDATRALSPTTMGQPAWVSEAGQQDKKDQENKGSTAVYEML